MKYAGKKLIYVNFSPYANAGNILDYLLEEFPVVIVYCFNFYKLGREQEPSTLAIYENKTIVYKFPLFQTPTPHQLVFILLPLRSLILFLQLFIHTLRLVKIYGKFDYFFTVNAFSAWCGNALRTCNLVEKTIFWVWDYYPPKHSEFMVRFMRWLYWQFDKPAAQYSDKVFFLNKRIGELRKSIGILSQDAPITTVGIATNPRKITTKKIIKEIHLVFFGVIKKSHGLDLVIEASEQLSKSFPYLSVHVIGGGPHEMYYRQKVKFSTIPFIFHGYIKKESEVDALIQSAHIGLAPYTDDESNVSQYTDPSKIKRYLVNGLPVISTNVFEFSQQITEEKAGIIIDYNSHALVNAVKEIKKNYKTYQQNALRLAKTFSYKKMYHEFFTS